jgi:hypothetical protein
MQAKANKIPSTDGEFNRFIRVNYLTWPPSLTEKAECAWLSLAAMEAGAAHQSEVTDAMNKRDLQAFVEAYEAFRANSVKGTEP